MKYLLINILMLMTASENILRLSRNIEKVNNGEFYIVSMIS